MSLEHWKAVIDRNLTSTFLMVKTCLTDLTSGEIVRLASQTERDGGGPGAVAYVMIIRAAAPRNSGRKPVSMRFAPV